MKILVTGAHGQLGNELRRCLETMEAEIGTIPREYAGAKADYIDFDELDISNADDVSSWFHDKGPYDIVFNCAAMTNVDGCERNEAAALKANAIGAMNVALAAAACNAKLVHISTDYVFAGNDPTPRREEDETCPVSAYGRSKLAGELLAMDACEKTFVVRTAWLYGYVGKNFAKTMIALATRNAEIAVVDDQLGNPTNANDLAYELLVIALTSDYGVYHCTNEGTCSWFEFANAVVDAAGIDCKKTPLTSEEYLRRFPGSARRPAYSSLENARLAATVGNAMRPWREALDSYMRNLAAMDAR